MKRRSPPLGRPSIQAMGRLWHPHWSAGWSRCNLSSTVAASTRPVQPAASSEGVCPSSSSPAKNGPRGAMGATPGLHGISGPRIGFGRPADRRRKFVATGGEGAIPGKLRSREGCQEPTVDQRGEIGANRRRCVVLPSGTLDFLHSIAWSRKGVCQVKGVLWLPHGALRELGQRERLFVRPDCHSLSHGTTKHKNRLA